MSKKSFGFSGTEIINLNSADTEQGILRFSLHLWGSNGYRIGDIITFSSEYNKVIYILN